MIANLLQWTNVDGSETHEQNHVDKSLQEIVHRFVDNFLDHPTTPFVGNSMYATEDAKNRAATTTLQNRSRDIERNANIIQCSGEQNTEKRRQLLTPKDDNTDLFKMNRTAFNFAYSFSPYSIPKDKAKDFDFVLGGGVVIDNDGRLCLLSTKANRIVVNYKRGEIEHTLYETTNEIPENIEERISRTTTYPDLESELMHNGRANEMHVDLRQFLQADFQERENITSTKTMVPTKMQKAYLLTAANPEFKGTIKYWKSDKKEAISLCLTPEDKWPAEWLILEEYSETHTTGVRILTQEKDDRTQANGAPIAGVSISTLVTRDTEDFCVGNRLMRFGERIADNKSASHLVEQLMQGLNDANYSKTFFEKLTIDFQPPDNLPSEEYMDKWTDATKIAIQTVLQNPSIKLSGAYYTNDYDGVHLKFQYPTGDKKRPERRLSVYYDYENGTIKSSIYDDVRFYKAANKRDQKGGVSTDEPKDKQRNREQSDRIAAAIGYNRFVSGIYSSVKDTSQKLGLEIMLLKKAKLPDKEMTTKPTYSDEEFKEMQDKKPIKVVENKKSGTIDFVPSFS